MPDSDMPHDEFIDYLSATVSVALENRADALRDLCPGDDEHQFIQHRDDRPPWCESCRYTERGVKVPGKQEP